MRANQKLPARRKGAAVNAREKRRLDGKPRLAILLSFARMGGALRMARYSPSVHAPTQADLCAKSIRLHSHSG